MRKFLISFGAILFCTFFINTVFGQTTVSYTGMGSVTCPASPVATISPAVPGLTFSQLSRGSGVTCGSATTGINGSGFNTNLATAISSSKWYVFSITADASTPFTVSALSIVSQVSNAGGSPNVSVQYAISGATPTTVIGAFTPTTTSAAYPFTTSISVGAGQTITFFVIPTNLTASTTTARVNNATSVTVIPFDITNSNTLPNGYTSVAYSQQLTSVGGVSPYTYALANATTLPPGLTIDGAGLISGTPTSEGVYNFDVTVTDSAPLSGRESFAPNASSHTESFQITILAPLAGEGVISGRVTDVNGNGLAKVSLMLSGGELSQPIVVRTNAFGYYTLPEVEVGATYTLTVSDKRYTFANPSRVINLQENISDADFVSEN